MEAPGASPLGRPLGTPLGAQLLPRVGADGELSPLLNAATRSPLSPGGLDLFSPMSVLIGKSGLSSLRVTLPKDDVPEVDDEMCGSPSTPGFFNADAGFGASEPKACPPTPYRPTHSLSRQDSLKDTKLLLATAALRRVSQTAGAMQSLTAGAPGGLPAGPPGGGEGAPAFAFEGHFDFLRVIGTSPTSEVWLVRSRSDGALSAVKRSLAEFTSRAERTRYLREVQAAAELPEHPHCVRYFRGWQQERHFYVQTELCAGGSLAGVLAALPPGAMLPEADVWRLARELAHGLAHCHRHGVLHLDVKPGNVFLDAAATAKLGDFGLAVLAGRGWASEEGDGGYCPPELLAEEGSPTAACDVYSLGATLHEAAAGAPPPRGAYGAPVQLPPGRSEALRALLQAMLAPDPTQRPAAQDVLRYACEAAGVPLPGATQAA